MSLGGRERMLITFILNFRNGQKPNFPSNYPDCSLCAAVPFRDRPVSVPECLHLLALEKAGVFLLMSRDEGSATGRKWHTAGKRPTHFGMPKSGG